MKRFALLIGLFALSIILPNILPAAEWKIVAIKYNDAQCLFQDGDISIEFFDLRNKTESVWCVKHFKIVQLIDHFGLKDERSLINKEIMESDINSPHIYNLVGDLIASRPTIKKAKRFSKN
jgi:hypothetical protein